MIEGRNTVLEAFRSGKTVDKLFMLDGCREGSAQAILKEAKKAGTVVQFVKKERLDKLSETKDITVTIKDGDEAAKRQLKKKAAKRHIHINSRTFPYREAVDRLPTLVPERLTSIFRLRETAKI